MDNTLNFLGLCKRAGALVTGEDGALGAVRSGEAKLLLLASDAAQNTSGKAAHYAELCSVCLVRLPYDKDSLGELLARRVCAVMAITDKNFAKSFLEKLTAAYPAYQSSLDELTEQFKPRRERRKKLQKQGE